MSILNVYRSANLILAVSDSEMRSRTGEMLSTSCSKFALIPGARAIVGFVGDSVMGGAAVTLAIVDGKPFAELVAGFRQQLDEAYEGMVKVRPQLADQARHVIVLAGFGPKGAQVYTFTKTYDAPFLQEEVADVFLHPPLVDVPVPTDREALLNYLDLQVPAVRQAHPDIAAGGEAWIAEMTPHRVTIERSHKFAPRPWTVGDGDFSEWRKRHAGA